MSRLDSRWGGSPDTLVVEELGTHFGASRVDVAVVNGALWGYELKSDADRLGRLPAQAEAFSEAFDYMTIVAASRHVARSLEIVPEWWGLIEAESNGDRIRLVERRRPKRNTEVDIDVVAALLWRDELASLLDDRGLAAGVRSATRDVLLRRAVDAVPPTDLAREVRERIRARPLWRVDPTRSPSDARSQPGRKSSGFLARRVR